jgi:hypothetical protein
LSCYPKLLFLVQLYCWCVIVFMKRRWLNMIIKRERERERERGRRTACFNGHWSELRKCENVLNWLPQGPLAQWVKWSAVYKFGDLVKQTRALLGFKE